MEKTEKSYSNTVFLPKTSFSMKGELVKKEPLFIKFWEEKDIYHKMLEKNSNSPIFFLHDGPPYANGHIHIGHALNKILKDFVVKSYSLMGYKTPYIPGWDCHGLPIEQQLLKELKLTKKQIDDVVLFRKKAMEFAHRFINIQIEEFKRLGVFGEWSKPYITMSKEYESNIVKVFLELFEKGYVERDKKTIYWCAECETALADAEVEYSDKISPSIYVKFKVLNKKHVSYDNLYFVVWTTTPWTLPANVAVALNKDENYIVGRFSDEYLILAEKLLDDFKRVSGIDLEVVEKLKGSYFSEFTYQAPLIDLLDEKNRYPRRVIFADFVDMTTGSGIVHIAPGHGEEDYHAGKEWGLEILCPVDERGRFTEEIGTLKGEFVFDANDKIIDYLRTKRLLISEGKISHSYPHCWRCKKPIIFRATEQWFLKIDKYHLREKLLEACKDVKWLPEQGYERITSMIKVRPDWCLSRQRYWGTPIIAFWCKKCGKIQKDFKVLYSIVNRIKEEGSDFWFTKPINEIVKGYRCECGSSEFEKERDILDVWLDSGVSWYAVCKERENIYPADLYLEGSDQHRGWFQTSLIPSVALNGLAPYKIVLTHGFVLDEHGRAMHKSLGNVVSPDEIISKYGAEILRMWVAMSNWHDDVRISHSLLSVPVDIYRKIRNTLRYLLGNLGDFSLDKSCDRESMLDIDKYILVKTSNMIEDVIYDWKNFEYRKAIKRISDFCILDLSSFYLDVSKDRLYTFSLNSLERRSAQTAMYEIFKGLCIILSPVLSFTSEEAWQTFRKEVDSTLPESVFLTNIYEFFKPYKNDKVVHKYEKILRLREMVLKEIEVLRKDNIIGSSLEAKVIFSADGDDYVFISNNLDEIITSCIVSQGEVQRGQFSVKVIKADGKKCLRCWQWREDVGLDSRWPDICTKCVKAIKDMMK